MCNNDWSNSVLIDFLTSVLGVSEHITPVSTNLHLSMILGDSESLNPREYYKFNNLVSKILSESTPFR